MTINGNFEPNTKFDVGILGWWYGQNFGSMLTYFAINKAVSNLGKSVVMIHEATGYNGWRVKWSDEIAPMDFARRQGYNYTEQQHYSNNSELNALTDTFMVGSDQLWNPHVGRVNDDLFLDFSSDDKKRIAYSTSFGDADNDKYKPAFVEKNSQNLKRFDALSVRENYAVKTAKDIFGVDAEQVLDPVFLIDKAEYEKLASEATTRIDGEYLLAFILDPSEKKKDVVKATAAKLGFEKVAVITDANVKQIAKAKEIFKEDIFEVIEEIKPENFLYAYQNAQYVVTDSFHGSVFSYIFRRPFSVFYNTTRGADRFINLMSLLGLEDSRRVYETNTADDINQNENVTLTIDYSKGEKQVAVETAKSQAWLEAAIDAPKKTDKILPAGETMIPSNSVSTEQILKNGIFVFYREGQHGEVLRQEVTFNQDGTLSGTNQTNEKYWTLEDSKLIFLNGSKAATTVFENIKSNYIEDEFRLVGTFVPNPRIHHVLETQKSFIRRTNQNPDFIKTKILVAKMRDYGIKDVVLAPGGRDLTLIRVIENNQDAFNIHYVTDERSAGYFALGIANKTQRPTAVVVTSGTAASNLAPAITEAFYMNLPVVAITADRYPEFHGQGEDQTIEQAGMFEPMIKKSVNIPTAAGKKNEVFTRRLVSEAILEATHNGGGPVHINISFDAVPNIAPIKKAYELPTLKHIKRVTRQDDLTLWDEYVKILKKSNKILLIYGQNFKPTAEQQKNIDAFAARYNVVILADWLSNLYGDKVVHSFNMLRLVSQRTFNKEIAPDIVISLGGKNVMNHPINFKLRAAPDSVRNWRVAPDGEIKDLYYHLSSVLETNQDWFFKYFSEKADNNQNNNDYLNKWNALDAAYPTPVHDVYNQKYVTQQVMKQMPEESLFHIGVGNTFMMTHTENLDPNKKLEIFLNMGTNGIDGSASAFMGQVATDDIDRLKFLMLGDMSFFYDMNSLWNKNLDGNVRIIMVNNSGSGLLKHYGSPGVTQAHSTVAEGWVKSLGFDYLSSKNKEDFDTSIKEFTGKDTGRPIFFEVFI
ncbi:2-succinyl-5-enolpyruvyl-6-hydroxy-3-cyclohexene-1-carboxylic-acid synthase [Lactococcus insecticola]|uniref:2-succinyl-5-enolpyruvyl-6-hydroxy-3-cyclohexene-1-carboxylate synthase n=1 Tax=Pseudolactococcus insecticola TaxID=2709158 RepID=A0A6A0B573_9LACT|nr:2-succinyl-5-enolpyruvyl-6-hydroxy-3-cyclohexene-1-carboxylic-acid synthase [Lactococcus insecticola]GFH39803.1 hypothetical protein Hs20B_02010 [Lactococcus insecticola]